MLRSIITALSLSVALATAPALAAWPDKPIRFIVPYTPGGATDLTARILAAHIGPTLGTTVVVENRAGASGNIGMEAAARSPADGYTLVMASAGQTIAASVFSKLSYDLQRDFVPVALAVRNQRMLVGRNGLPYSNVRELVDYAKAHPGRVTYASFGAGSSGHLAGELFALQAGIRLTFVQYKGNAEAVNDVVGGTVDVLFSELSSVLQYVQAGKLKAYAMGSDKRYAGAPGVPTVAESGLTGVEVSGWLGVMAPAGTPTETVRALNAAIVKALGDPEVNLKFAGMGAESVVTTPESFGEFIAQDLAKWARVVSAAKVRAD